MRMTTILICFAFVSFVNAFVKPPAPTSPAHHQVAPTLPTVKTVPCRRETALQGKKMSPGERSRWEKEKGYDSTVSTHDWDSRRQPTPSLSTDRWGERQRMPIGDDEIVYDAYEGLRAPAVLYLPAFDSPNNDLKAAELRSFCNREDHAFISMEWYGVGDSTGSFELGTISRWKQDAITLIDRVLPDPEQQVIIIGGGVGGWIATLIALERPDLVGGIVGLAADPDFTENLLMRYLPKAKQQEIMNNGVAMINWGQATYPVSKLLIDDARDNLVLEGPVGGLPINCPVRLVHGLDDEEVPYTVSLDLSRRIGSKDVNLYLVKTANHHLDGVVILRLVIQSLKEVIAAYVPPSLAGPLLNQAM